MLAHLSSQNSWPGRRSPTNWLLPDFRLDEAEFPPAAQTALKLLVWTLRGPRAVDCASCDALRPQLNWLTIKDYYEISIFREKLATASRGIPKAVRVARRAYGFEGSREKERLAKNRSLLWRRK
jgi:hypothetical protein